jgi:hypothetical protein
MGDCERVHSTKERQVIVSRIILIAAIVLAAVAADGAEIVRRQVVRGPLGRRRQVVVDRQQIVLPRQSAIIVPHSQQLIVPQQLVVPHHFAQPLIIVR